ncbi:hypothetical protein PFLmoz3_04604 [Pseudomonas fluorescens]|uniref:Uncharacterized protein n=1 Tax=Pseudomonas fluorescens TaxID=294 RepID=A0A120G6J5_PSEFL|nr:hypothetical protein PFLmoz3_04604 [Pseudomonas fluorescens]
MTRREAGKILKASALQCKPFYIDHPRHQPRQGQNRLARFDLLTQARRQHHLYPLRALSRWPLNLKVDGHLVQWIGDELVGFHLDLPGHFLITEAGVHVNQPGNYRRARNRHGGVPGRGTQARQCLLQHTAHSLKVQQGAVQHRLGRQHLHNVALDAETA